LGIGILPPTGQRHELPGGTDATAHSLDLALVLGAERIVTPDFGDERHTPLSGRDAVFTLAPTHVDRSTP